jgi:hypothetical protein
MVPLIFSLGGNKIQDIDVRENIEDMPFLRDDDRLFVYQGFGNLLEHIVGIDDAKRGFIGHGDIVGQGEFPFIHGAEEIAFR